MARNPCELLVGNSLCRSFPCRAALAKFVFAIWCCVIGSEKLFPQYMQEFEPLSKSRTTVGEEQLSGKLCVRSQLLLHC